MLDWIFDPNAWIALLTLTALEIVLGIDNIVFISIFVGRVPPHQRKKARLGGLSMAMIGDGFNLHIPKGYIYFAMVYSLLVELLNLKIRRKPAA
jgi:predicted tellurium resistance membrane protein TerC